ncbi:MAG: radical SAM protein [bacterium]
MEIDNEVKLYFDNKIKQVFVYVTNRCQLNCKQCLYKPLLDKTSSDLDYNTMIKLLKEFKKYGAYKISFLGGEPSIYYDKKNNKTLSDVIKSVKEIGYKYIRIDTNGQFNKSFLEDTNIKLLDEITFSLDGHDAKCNDIVRGKGSYDNAINNIKYAVELGYNVQITCCIHSYTCKDQISGLENIDSMIKFSELLKINTINFHPILKVGVDRDSWIDNTDINLDVWRDIYDVVIEKVLNNDYSVNVRLPMRGIEKDKVKLNKDKYFYCPVDMGERALIMPNNQIKVCAFTIGTDECVARFDSEKILWNINSNNETLKLGSLKEDELCYNQVIESKKLIPLCMSYKPYQKEIVWEDIKLKK